MKLASARTPLVILLAWYATAVCVSAQAAARPLRDAVIFGDSLSDPGNAYALTGAIQLAPYPLVPIFPYAIGGHRLSNGRTWAEQLAGRVITAASAGPAFRQPGVKTNYAVGASRARSGQGPIPEADLSVQVATYLADFGGQARPETVYVLFIGSNDVRDAFAALGTDPTGATSQAIAAAALQSIAANVQALHAAGARHFLVANSPDIGLTPAVSLLGPLAVTLARQVSASYNQALELVLATLDALPAIRITRVDAFAGLSDVAANPEAYGLVNTQEPCLRFDVTARALCSRPNDYLFWDGVHPTRAGQRAIATIMRPGF